MNKDKKNRITSIYVAVGAHLALALVFFLMIAWSEPDPPIPEYGIEFNLGAEFISNSSQDDKPVKAEEISAEEEVQEEKIEEEVEEIKETTEEIEAVEPELEEVEEPVEEVSEESVEEPSEVVASEDIHSPHVVENSEVKKEVKKEVEKVVAKKEKEEVTETKTEQVTEPQIDERAIYKKSDSGQGTGNKGASLDLSGWMWDGKPNPDDQSDENGYIIFEIKVDEEGEIVGIKTLEKTVSPVVEQVYKQSVRDLTFSRTSDNSSSALISTGKVTFIIQSK